MAFIKFLQETPVDKQQNVAQKIFDNFSELAEFLKEKDKEAVLNILRKYFK